MTLSLSALSKFYPRQYSTILYLMQFTLFCQCFSYFRYKSLPLSFIKEHSILMERLPNHYIQVPVYNSKILTSVLQKSNQVTTALSTIFSKYSHTIPSVFLNNVSLFRVYRIPFCLCSSRKSQTHFLSPQYTLFQTP